MGIKGIALLAICIGGIGPVARAQFTQQGPKLAGSGANFFHFTSITPPHRSQARAHPRNSFGWWHGKFELAGGGVGQRAVNANEGEGVCRHEH